LLQTNSPLSESTTIAPLAQRGHLSRAFSSLSRLR